MSKYLDLNGLHLYNTLIQNYINSKIPEIEAIDIDSINEICNPKEPRKTFTLNVTQPIILQIDEIEALLTSMEYYGESVDENELICECKVNNMDMTIYYASSFSWSVSVGEAVIKLKLKNPEKWYDIYYEALCDNGSLSYYDFCGLLREDYEYWLQNLEYINSSNGDWYSFHESIQNSELAPILNIELIS